MMPRAPDILGSACRTVLPSDLQYLTDEDLEEIGNPSCCRRFFACCADDSFARLLAGGALTRVEKKRLQAAVQAARGAPLPLPPASLASANLAPARLCM